MVPILFFGGEDISMFNGKQRCCMEIHEIYGIMEFAQEEMAKCSQIPVNKATLESDTVKMLILHHLSRLLNQQNPDLPYPAGLKSTANWQLLSAVGE